MLQRIFWQHRARPTCQRVHGFQELGDSCSGCLNQLFHAGKVAKDPSHLVLTGRIQEHNIRVRVEFSAVGSEPIAILLFQPAHPRQGYKRIKMLLLSIIKMHRIFDSKPIACKSALVLRADSCHERFEDHKTTTYAIATCRLSDTLLKKAKCRSACASGCISVFSRLESARPDGISCSSNVSSFHPEPVPFNYSKR